MGRRKGRCVSLTAWTVQMMLVGPFAGFVQQLAPALRGPDFISAFAPFRESIGVDRLPEPERSRVAATQRLEQSVVLDHWTGPLTTPPRCCSKRLMRCSMPSRCPTYGSPGR